MREIGQFSSDILLMLHNSPHMKIIIIWLSDILCISGLDSLDIQS